MYLVAKSNRDEYIPFCVCRDKQTAIDFTDAAGGEMGYSSIPYFEGHTKPQRITLYKGHYRKDQPESNLVMTEQTYWNFELFTLDVVLQENSFYIFAEGAYRSSVILMMNERIKEYEHQDRLASSRGR